MRASVAGQYDGFAAQGLDSGLERSKNGRNLGFLANMEWRPKHVVLASCHAVAGLQILSRQEDEYHLAFTRQALQGGAWQIWRVMWRLRRRFGAMHVGGGRA